jgi:type IV pilus assembly protein PilB
VARLLDKTGGKLTKDMIGLVGEDLRKYEKMIRCRNGVILIVGPTGSGKSTTLYTIVGDLNTREVNLVTLEDPVEYNIEGVNQVPINEKTGMTFASGLRAILRQDPDIIGVGEIRDGETAEIAMRSAITGHVVLSTLHTNDAVGVIDRLGDIGVEPYLTASALKGVISQRLVRRICPNCREAYTPTDEELEDLGIEREPDLKFYRGKGCPRCFDTGYRGRIAVFEILTINRKIRRLIADSAGREAIEKELFGPDGDFVTLHENAIRLVKEGTTSCAEVVRVIAQED